MAARDRYTVTYECAKCGTKGEARCSEDDYPFMRKLHFNFDSIDPAFVVKRTGKSLTDSHVVCATCGGDAV